ncbi:PH domain-containing protein [Pseudomonas chlororaphis]
MEPQMELDRNEALAIISELKRWHDEARSLIDDAADKSRLSSNSIDLLKARLTKLKGEIKDAAKYETLSHRKAPKTDLEQFFFGPAVRSTSANFRMRTDTSPHSQSWVRGLYEVELELSYALHNLETYLKENS